MVEYAGGMKIAVIADVHGNSLALEAVLHDIGRDDPDLIVNLGAWFPDRSTRPAVRIFRCRFLP